MSNESCTHLDRLDAVAEPIGTVCQRCVDLGDSWVHLRSCLVCGLVGCCDNSKNQHARRHWEEGSHPLIRSIEPGDNWLYCFADDVVRL